MFKLINGWTKEKVMEQVKKYNNGKRAMNDLSCVYQDNNGNRCAVGCFIPDNHGALNFSGCSSNLLRKYPSLVPLMPFDSLDLDIFQRRHDNCQGNVYKAIQTFLDNEVK